MSNASGLVKNYTKQSKTDSKTQKLKQEYVQKHPVAYVRCENCNKNDVALYNIDGKYYCKEHIPMEEK